jgi:3-oxoacyl-[acyl-carrier protein] reductase
MDSELLAKFGLEGRGAVITGAASGIGREAAITFARAGARLVLADINAAGLEETRRQTARWTNDVLTVPLDVRDRAAVQDLADQAAARGSVDVWANVAGVLGHALIADAQEAELDRIVGVNLKGVYWGCAAAARVMGAQGSGSIINISSTGADLPIPGLSLYAMTKAAVNMITRTLAAEVGPKGVRVNAVAPGVADTPMNAHRYTRPDGSIDEDMRREVFAALAARSPLGKTGEASDMAMMMLFLASDASRFVTGQVMRPNGGMSMP